MILPSPIRDKMLVTGASGFLGGRLRAALLEAGADVVAIRRPSSPPSHEGRSAEADYADAEGLAELVEREKPDFVFHLAGATKGVTYEDFQRANVMPTRNLMAAVRRAHPGLKRFVLVSSLASYGPSAPGRPHREGDPPRPIEHYGRSKLEAEEALEREAGEVPFTILRPGGVYGPGDVDYFNLFKEVERGRNVFFGNRRRLFSPLYVDDCVRAIVASALTEACEGRGYFLADGDPVTWEDFQRAIAEASDRRVREIDLPELLVPLAAVGGEVVSLLDKRPRLFNRQKAKMGAQQAWTCENEQAHRDFGFSPEVDYREGVRRALRWYRDAGWL